MASVSIDDYITSLLKKDIATPRTKTQLSPEVDSSNLMSQISLCLYLNPRAALYYFILARNALVAAAGSEMSSIQRLRKSLFDLKNVSYSIEDHKKLSSAMDNLERAVVSGGISPSQLSLVSSSITSFLNGDIRKNVIGGGTDGMLRPSSEAEQDIPVALQELKDLHSVLLSKLYYLVVGLRNFKSINFQDIQGPTLLNRVKNGLSAVIEETSSDPSGYGSRSIVNRLIAYNAALSSLSSSVDPHSSLVDSLKNIPDGYTMVAESDTASPSIEGLPGPFSFTGPSSISVQDKSGPSSISNFPIQGYDLKNQAHITGSFPLTYPQYIELAVSLRASSSVTGWVSSPSPGVQYYSSTIMGDYWIKDQSDRYHKVFKVSGLVNSNNDIISLLQSSIGPSFVDVPYYPYPGSNKFCLVAKYQPGPSCDSIAILPYASRIVPGPPVSLEQVSSSQFSIGLFDYKESSYGYIRTEEVSYCLSSLFGGKISSSVSADGKVIITGVDSSIGAFLTVSGPAAEVMGLSSTSYGVSDKFHLVGSVNGSPKDIINPKELFGAYDLAVIPTGSFEVKSVTDKEVTLPAQSRTFSGSIIVTSRLVSAQMALDQKLSDYIDVWLSSGFEKDLAKVDYSMASAMSTRSSSSIGDASSVLEKLSSSLSSLVEILTDPSTVLPPTYYSKDINTATAILDALSERKMDSVEDMLLEGRVQEALLLLPDELSHGKALSKAVSEIAKNDIVYINTAKSDGQAPKAIRRN